MTQITASGSGCSTPHEPAHDGLGATEAEVDVAVGHGGRPGGNGRRRSGEPHEPARLGPVRAKIVGKFDVVGVVVLVAYVVFSVFRSRLVGYAVPAEQLTATSTGLLSGVMLGQVLGIRRGLRIVGRRLRASGPDG